MIIERWAEDDVEALMIANVIEEHHGQVVSITANGEATHPGALAPHTRSIVWARLDDGAPVQRLKRIDKAIERRLNAQGAS